MRKFHLWSRRTTPDFFATRLYASDHGLGILLDHRNEACNLFRCPLAGLCQFSHLISYHCKTPGPFLPIFNNVPEPSKGT